MSEAAQVISEQEKESLRVCEKITYQNMVAFSHFGALA